VESAIGIRYQDQAPVRHAREGLDGTLNLDRSVPDGTEYKLDPERGSRGLGCAQVVK
jgi:hypothetical protein